MTGDDRTGNPAYDYTGVFFEDSSGKSLPATAQVCGLTMTFYSPAAVTWEPLANADSNWSTPVQISTTQYNRATYYLYRTTYLQGACFRLGDYAKIGYRGWFALYYGWRSTTCFNTKPGTSFRLSLTATVNKVPLTKDSGWTSLS